MVSIWVFVFHNFIKNSAAVMAIDLLQWKIMNGEKSLFVSNPKKPATLKHQRCVT